MSKYRIVESRPGCYAIQQLHRVLWWKFWIYASAAEFGTPTDAEQCVRDWLEDEAHILRVVKVL